LHDAEAKTRASGLNAWPVCSHEDVIGVISREGIESATKNGDGENRLREIVPPDEFPHVHADHSLHTTLDRMGAAGLDVLPVVSRANAHQLLGIVTVDDVLALYGVRPR
jgi:predicted transcriptional regulator